MTIFDVLFYNVFQHYKPTQKKKANSIALYYINTLQCTLLLIAGIVITTVLNDTNISTMSSGNAWTLFILACLFLIFRNWIQYSGKKRKLLNVKFNSKKKPELYNMWLLWALLVSAIILAIAMLTTV